MDFLQILLITVQLLSVLSKRYASSSDESIENLLYFKDCQKKKPKEEPTHQEPMKLREQIPEPQRQFECPFPKMCCSLSCNNECGGNGVTSIFGRQMENAAAPMQPPFPPRQPQLPVLPLQRGHRKKIKPLLPPVGGRREFGFTKEKIKSLIAKDDDIRKILKDLVRVTMQKVDLVEMINTRRNLNEENKKLEVSKSDYDYDLE